MSETKCEVCDGHGYYPIYDNKGGYRYDISCPECFGSGNIEVDEVLAEPEDWPPRSTAAGIRSKAALIAAVRSWNKSMTGLAPTTFRATDPLFLMVCEIAKKDGAAPLDNLPGCWERKIGEEWWVAINAHAESMKCSRGAEVPPFNCYVEFLGWPAGLFGPYGGIFAAGEEDGFVAAIEKEMAE